MTHTGDEGVVETLPGSWAPPGSRPIELVFRTVGERTSDLALELALEHIRPHRAHVIRDVRPWELAVRRMLKIDHRCSHVVYVDADCLILEDMRPFLDANELAYVDCYVRDRFRGRIHCGVHITRIDVVRAMRAIPTPIDALGYVVSPEAYLRNIALFQLGCRKQFKNFHILHDHFQSSTDIFVKYARRELRSRTEPYKKELEVSMSRWGDGLDFEVAQLAVRHAASAVPLDATPRQVDQYLCNLPSLARAEVRRLGSSQNGQAGIEEVDKALATDLVDLGLPSKKFKVFGIGLSGTGTRSLTEALHVLGFDTVHYPTDRATLDTLVRGDARFPLLEHYDGITDITAAPYYEDLDRAWPGSKFVLTVCDEDRWLLSWFAQHQDAEQYEKDPVSMEIQRFLRAAVYASHEFDEERFRHAYRRHVERVTRYFAGRDHDLLVLDICGGDGYEQLAPFLGVPVPAQPFPSEAARMADKRNDAQNGNVSGRKPVAGNLGSPSKKMKVFGIGLSRTGTRSLTTALRVLGFDTVHYPTDRATLDTLVRGDARFPLLEHCDGITDITAAPYYEDLDQGWPGSKFVLTVRDEDSWLRSCRNHWARPLADKEAEKPRSYMEIQRFLRAAVYASHEFDEERFRHAYRRHVECVTRYFAGRDHDLLVLDICGGDGYAQLAPFLGVPVPAQPFPGRGNGLTERMAEKAR